MEAARMPWNEHKNKVLAYYILISDVIEIGTNVIIHTAKQYGMHTSVDSILSRRGKTPLCIHFSMCMLLVVTFACKLFLTHKYRDASDRNICMACTKRFPVVPLC